MHNIVYRIKTKDDAACTWRRSTAESSLLWQTIIPNTKQYLMCFLNLADREEMVWSSYLTMLHSQKILRMCGRTNILGALTRGVRIICNVKAFRFACTQNNMVECSSKGSLTTSLVSGSSVCKSLRSIQSISAT